MREDIIDATELYVSFYLRVDALPSSTTRILRLSLSGTSVGEIYVTSAGKLRLKQGGTTIGADSAALSVGTLYRVGLHQKQGSGTNAVLEAYVASGTTAFAFGSAFAASSTLTFTSAVRTVSVGATNSSVAAAVTVDDLTLDTGSMPAP